jgi:hypothetical protein
MNSLEWPLVRLLASIWRWGRVVWICRVPLASAILGGGLLVAAPQARDLFADLGLSAGDWAIFFLAVVIWGAVVHSVGRRSLQSDYWVPEAQSKAGLSDARRRELQALYDWPATIVPRTLGLLVFFFVGWSIFRTRRNLLPAEGGLPEANHAVALANVLLAVTVVLGVAFATAVWRRRKVEGRLAKSSLLWPPPGPALLAGHVPFPLSVARWWGDLRHGEPFRTCAIRLAFDLFSALVVLSFVVALVKPFSLAEWVPRVLFAPLLLGGIVIVLGWVAVWSHRLSTPFLLLLAAVSVLLLLAVDRFHDVRWIGATRASIAAGPQRQITLAEAVARWKQVNQCEGAAAHCPRPILIAGAGGASRAAYLTSTLVGALIDLGNDPATGATYGKVRQRIFAMSTVSGSSVGAVVMRAALADAAENETPDKPPCKKLVSQAGWFRSLESVEPGQGTRPDPTTSWRDCFQLLLTGDYLSPVLVGLVYRDNFPVVNPSTRNAAWDDRATLLEQGFERRYFEVTQGRAPQSCGEESGAGLCRAFGWHPDPSVAHAWLPLLFINGTSVSTGRRIIASDIPMGDHYAGTDALLPFAYDINELRAPPKLTPHAGEQGSDIRLSTAATMSARFPIISPHGNIRDLSGDVRDKIVDGGYFENDGLATIADVAAALKNAFRLDPVVIRIVNEPSTAALEDHRLGPDRPPLPNADERTPFDDIGSIFRALTATRSGHEDGHEAYLKSIVGDDRLYEVHVYPLVPSDEQGPSAKQMAKPVANPICRRAVKQRVAMEQVSMSWWISQPVRAYLDAQLCVKENWERLECELRQGRSDLGEPCPAQKP